MINKKSSYRKLKEKNERLKKDIYNIIRNSDKEIGIETRLRYEMKYDLQDNIFFGDIKC